MSDPIIESRVALVRLAEELQRWEREYLDIAHTIPADMRRITIIGYSVGTAVSELKYIVDGDRRRHG